MVSRKRRGDPQPPARLVRLPAAEVKGARSQLQHHTRPARADLLGAEAGAHQRPAQLDHGSGEAGAATPALQPDGLAEHRRGQRAAGEQRLGDPAGLLPQGCLVKVVRFPSTRIAVGQQLGSKKRGPPPAQQPTRPGGAARPSSPTPAARLDPRPSPRTAWAARLPPRRARAGPRQGRGTTTRSLRRRRTLRPGRCCGSAGPPATSVAPAWPGSRPYRDCTTSVGHDRAPTDGIHGSTTDSRRPAPAPRPRDDP
jgi:hypothetical protein